jgi:hypothetical protein
MVFSFWMKQCLVERQSPAPERLTAFTECLLAGEADVAEESPIVSELAQRLPLAAADDPGHDGFCAYAERGRLPLWKSDTAMGLAYLA